MNRLTKKNDKDFYTSIPNFPYDNRFEIIQKLGKIEDLMEKYGIESLEELSEVLNIGTLVVLYENLTGM